MQAQRMREQQRWGPRLAHQNNHHQMRRDDRRPPQNARHDYDNYETFDQYPGQEYGNDDATYEERWPQPPDMYENVAESRNFPPPQNVARIQIGQDQPAHDDYDDLQTLDRPMKKTGEIRETRQFEQPRHIDDRRDGRQSEQSRHRDQGRDPREAEQLARHHEPRRDEREERRESRQEREHPAKHNAERRGSREVITQSVPQQQQQKPVREPHLRFEPSPAPFQGHRGGIIDGYQSTPNQNKNARDQHNRDHAEEQKHSNPPAPPSSIRAIINNLKGNSDSKHTKEDRREAPRNKLSTNPFLRGGASSEKSLSPRRAPHDNGQHTVSASSVNVVHQQPVNNVQEVVQKMNSGEWPIRIDDDDHHKIPQRPRSQQSFEQPKRDKARQWETLDRRSPDRPTETKKAEPPRPNLINQRNQNVRDVVREADEERRRASDSDHCSERSESAQHTSVSTDSAMGTEESATYDSQKLHLPFELPQGTILRKLPENVRELNNEAERLLMYFKGHRAVLNYLGIGLSETLWNHIRALPNYSAEIEITQTDRGPSRLAEAPPSMKKAPATPQITITQPPYSPNKTSRMDGAENAKTARSMQSPKLTALERELCTDTVLQSEPEGYCGQEQSAPRRDQIKSTSDARSGRFVKKSAAALIAKKQGQTASMAADDVPMSSDFADPRIAAEIAQLRAREEELIRSRSQLGLPTIQDVMDTWSGKSPIPCMKQMDHHRQMDQKPLVKSQSAHNIYIDGDRGSPMKDDRYYNYGDQDQQMYGTDPRQKSDESIQMNRYHAYNDERRHEREDQFFRDPLVGSSTSTRQPRPVATAEHREKGRGQYQQQLPIKRMDITVHGHARSSSSQVRGGRQIGL